MSIAVAIVEDDPRIRESLTVLLCGVDGFHCVGSHGSAEEALRAIPAEKPDVVLLDINLPQMSGVDCVAQLKVRLPAVQILMLTVYDDSDTVFRALTEGASGYIIKRTAPVKLLEAIREAHTGGSPMSPHIARKVVQYFHQRGGAQWAVDGNDFPNGRRIPPANAFRFVTPAATVVCPIFECIPPPGSG